MTFEYLRLSGWRQFKTIEIDFHPNLTIITGSNGAGKTTLLNMLSGHFGWQFPLVSTPSSGTIEGQYAYLSDLWDAELVQLTGLFLEHNASSIAAQGPRSGWPTEEDRERLMERFDQVMGHFPPSRRESLVAAFKHWLTEGRFDPDDVLAAGKNESNRSIGIIGYSEGNTSPILVPTQVKTSYQDSIPRPEADKGVTHPFASAHLHLSASSVDRDRTEGARADVQPIHRDCPEPVYGAAPRQDA